MRQAKIKYFRYFSRYFKDIFIRKSDTLLENLKS